ncbi:uncharacterized protein LOC134673961 [Cydia fagiglandana]|uniref:uncharacterized protein LOC134673961 n=1 Tax=Cydia fagiglandana TaxID=1458189 RepID=UPI002FEDF309
MDRKPRILILLTLYCISSTEAVFSQNKHIRTEIKYGEACGKGQVYRKDCNTCHCIGSHLVCTKMGCLRHAKERTSNEDLRNNNEQVCVAGKFYKDGCRRCFCSDEKRLLCGPIDCNTVSKLPTTHEAIHAHSKYSPSQQHKLPILKHRFSECTPGSSYRLDCNTCLCLANGNLQCGQMFCPSHDDVHRVKAKALSGQPCDDLDIIDKNLECVICQCVGGTNICHAKPNCVPVKKHEPIEENSGKQCSPGMIYKRACNKCLCTETHSLRCTMKSCLSKTQASRAHMIRKAWVDYTLRKAGKKT